MVLTKSDFRKYLQCSCHLWLHKFHSDWLGDDSAADKARFEAGREIDVMARQLFPGGVDAEGDTFAEGVKNTKRLIKEGARIIYQPTVVAGSLSCRGDILVYHPEEKSWDLYEVKSAARSKEIDLEDVTFQKICFDELGIPLRRVHVIHVNGRFIRRGPIKPEKFFITTDVTESVARRTDEVREKIRSALAVLRWGDKPGLTQLNACLKPRKCEYVECYLEHVSKSALTALVKSVHRNQLIPLLERGLIPASVIPVKTLKALGRLELPPDPHAPPEILIGKEAIRHKLEALQYPLYFLDYETVNPALPPFDGYRPYEQMPFQYSLDVVAAPGATPVHYEFLAEKMEDPAPEIAASLAKRIGPRGYVLAWYARFESGCNEDLARHSPKHAAFLRSLNRRMFDPGHVFFRPRTGHYHHSGFGGSWSLKKVLPVLLPHLAYGDLAIQEGMTASNSWYLLTGSALTAAEKKKLHKDMLEYCGRDTIAMVEIIRHLDEVSSEQRRML